MIDENKTHINTDRAVLKVRWDGIKYPLMEQILDPVKFCAGARSGIFYYVDNKFCVHVDEARKLGYEVIEV